MRLGRDPQPERIHKMSKIPTNFWESASGKTLISSLHESYWDALSSLSAIEDALRMAGSDADAQIAEELTKAAQLIRSAHDKVATLNNRICPDKMF